MANHSHDHTADVTAEVEELPESRVKISASVPASDVDHALEHAAGHFGAEMRFPGFRKGKVPAKLVLQRLGRDAVMDEAIREFLPVWYERALLGSKVTPVGEPSLDMSDPPAEGEALEFTIEVGVRPAAKLGDYEGLEVGKPEPEVPTEQIDAEVERMRESLAGLETVEREGADGDFLLIDFVGVVDDEEFEGGTSTDYLLELGSGSLIDGFESALVGAKAGDERKAEVTFPEEYHAEHLAGKPAVFTVQVKEVREKSLPELDDDFAADNSDFDTLDELRGDIENRLKDQAEHQAEHAFRDAALEAAIANAEVEVPDDIVTARATEVWERVERQLQQSGMDPEMYLQMQGKTREETIAESADDAAASLKREAVLAAIADAEDFEVSEDDLLEALQPPAGQKGKPEKLLRRLRSEGRDALLIEEIRMNKAAELVVESAKPVAAEAAKPEDEDEPASDSGDDGAEDEKSDEEE